MSTVLATAILYRGSAVMPMFSAARAMLLPGRTTSGHYQIELACETCHGEPFGGSAPLQEACVRCHAAALAEADDKHPASKFDDPRNAPRLEKIDARQCIACHAEHRPHATLAMGVTRPPDVCHHCHSGDEEMPPDHKNFKFDGCAAAGCHNYHDNRALYESFLLRRAHDPALLPKRELPKRDLKTELRNSATYPRERYPLQRLSAAAQDAPAHRPVEPKVYGDWFVTAHADAGVNCSACHVVGATVPDGAPKPQNNGQWVDRPSTPQACQGCHALEAAGFLSGRHGMRLAQGLPPMTPAQARQPMRPEAAHAELNCTSCHGAHRFDTRAAALEACLGCHDDKHTRAYTQSPHYVLWRKELAGEVPAGSGVSCASCHLPRLRIATEEGARRAVQHNQNAALRPNEKMIRPVCLACHGLAFSIDALADRGLIDRNFRGQPDEHVSSIDMALQKERQKSRARAP